MANIIKLGGGVGGNKLLGMIDCCVTDDQKSESGSSSGNARGYETHVFDSSRISFDPTTYGSDNANKIYYINILKATKLKIVLICTNSGTPHNATLTYDGTTIFSEKEKGSYTYSVDLPANAQLQFKFMGHSNKNAVQGRAVLFYE